MNGLWRTLGSVALTVLSGVTSLGISAYFILTHRLTRELVGLPRPQLAVPLLVYLYLTSPIWSAAGLHYLEGSALLLTTDADGSLGVAALLSFFHHRDVASAAMFGASAAALWALFDERCPQIARLLALAPQQVLLIITALGAISAVGAGEYADLVQRPSIFILCDQYARIVAAVIHSLAIAGRLRLRIV